MYVDFLAANNRESEVSLQQLRNPGRGSLLLNGEQMNRPSLPGKQTPLTAMRSAPSALLASSANSVEALQKRTPKSPENTTPTHERETKSAWLADKFAFAERQAGVTGKGRNGQQWPSVRSAHTEETADQPSASRRKMVLDIVLALVIFYWVLPALGALLVWIIVQMVEFPIQTDLRSSYSSGDSRVNRAFLDLALHSLSPVRPCEAGLVIPQGRCVKPSPFSFVLEQATSKACSAPCSPAHRSIAGLTAIGSASWSLTPCVAFSLAIDNLGNYIHGNYKLLPLVEYSNILRG